MAPNQEDPTKYDHDILGHDRRTGSLALDNSDCAGEEGDPPVREPVACQPCLINFTDEVPPGRMRPMDSIAYGFTSWPEDKSKEIKGELGAQLDNQIITNWRLCCIENAICAIVSQMANLIDAVDDFSAMAQIGMAEIKEAIENIQVDVSTDELVEAINGLKDKMHWLFTVSPPA